MQNDRLTPTREPTRLPARERKMLHFAVYETPYEGPVVARGSHPAPAQLPVTLSVVLEIVTRNKQAAWAVWSVSDGSGGGEMEVQPKFHIDDNVTSMTLHASFARGDF